MILLDIIGAAIVLVSVLWVADKIMVHQFRLMNFAWSKITGRPAVQKQPFSKQ